MSAPERIWVAAFDGVVTWAFARDYFGKGGGPSDDMDATEYVRADRLTEAVEALPVIRRGLECAMNYATGTGSEYAEATAAALAALAKLEGQE